MVIDDSCWSFFVQLVAIGVLKLIATCVDRLSRTARQKSVCDFVGSLY